VAVAEPRFILRLSDVPSVIEADGQIWPVYMTTRDAARLFGVDRVTIRLWCQEREITHLKVGTRVLVDVASAKAFVDRHVIKAKVEPRVRVPRVSAGTMFNG
jgi:excisionase family DNA binding protein